MHIGFRVIHHDFYQLYLRENPDRFRKNDTRKSQNYNLILNIYGGYDDDDVNESKDQLPEYKYSKLMG